MRSTETGKQDAAKGNEFAGAALGSAQKPRAALSSTAAPLYKQAQSASNLDFLPQPAVVLLNLKPNADGVILIDRRMLGIGSQLCVVALHGSSTVFRCIALSEKPFKYEDLRLTTRALNNSKHFAEQKQVSFVQAGEKFQVEDITTSSFELYDNLKKVYRLLVALSSNETLSNTFSFILQWPLFTFEQKVEKYSKFTW